MNNVRKIFGVLMTVVLAAFALPAAGQSKIFSLTMSYQSSTTITGPAGTTTAPTYRAVYKNETPNGNSTINSVILSAPAGVVIANAQLQPQFSTNNTSITGLGTNSISISYISGIKAGGNTGYVDVQISGGPTTCGPWGAQAFAGNAFSQPFQLQNNLSTLSLGSCKVNLVMAPLSVNQNSAVSMTGTLTNTSGWAVGSFKLAAPTTIGLTIPSLPNVTLPGTTNATVAWCAAAGGDICVSNIAPALEPNAQAVVNLLSVNVAATCTTNLTGNWSATAYAGGTQNGTAFPTDAASQLATNVSASSCTVSVSPSPAQNGIQGTALPPVTVTVGGGSGSGTASVTASGCTLADGSTTSLAISGSAIFKNLTISGASTSCTLTFAVTGYPNGANYGPFTVFAGGPLKCGDHFSGSTTTDISTPGYAQGRRGFYNKDGATCNSDGVGYTFTNNILGDTTAGGSVVFQWDTTADPAAAFVYTLTWKPEYVDPTTGLPSRVTKVQWFGPGAPATPVIGRACIAWNPTNAVALGPDYLPSQYLPAPYGTLSVGASASSSGATDTLTVAVTAPAPSAVPFPIMVGKEYMTVTAISGTSWTVTRGVGGTSALLAHPSGAAVMSTPLPLDGSGQLMRMCIVDEGWTAVPAGDNDCPTFATSSPTVALPTVPTSCVMTTTTIYDIGDGGVSRSP